MGRNKDTGSVQVENREKPSKVFQNALKIVLNNQFRRIF